MARYVVGECTPEEAAEVQAQLQQHSEDARLIAAIAERTNLRLPAPADLDVEGALAKVHARIASGDPSRALPFRRHRWVVPSIGILAAAAAIVVIMILPRRNNPTSSNTVAEASGYSRVYATATGKRDSVLLADSTAVVLGPGSRLVVPPDYNRTTRSVRLRGVAFFDVRHDAAKPFTVHVDDVEIQDVGTAFSVSDESDGSVDVAVAEGAVQLDRGSAPQQGGPVAIRAGQRGVIAPSGKTRIEAMSNSDLAWMHGKLEFRDAPLTKVSADLKRWYGVELRPDSSLVSRHFTGTFNDDPLANVLKSIGLTLGARAEQRGDTIFLRTPSK